MDAEGVGGGGGGGFLTGISFLPVDIYVDNSFWGYELLAVALRRAGYS